MTVVELKNTVAEIKKLRSEGTEETICEHEDRDRGYAEEKKTG